MTCVGGPAVLGERVSDPGRSQFLPAPMGPGKADVQGWQNPRPPPVPGPCVYDSVI